MTVSRRDRYVTTPETDFMDRRRTMALADAMDLTRRALSATGAAAFGESKQDRVGKLASVHLQLDRVLRMLQVLAP